jgi:hypothetical protein
MLKESIKPHVLFPLRKAGIRWLWENMARPGWRAIKKLDVLAIFFLLAVGAVVWAYLLQGVAFPPTGSSGSEQISATVYVQTLPAQVNLKSEFTPGAAENNFSLRVNVTGPANRPDPWLLIVQCMAPTDKPYRQAVPLWTEAVTGTQNNEKVLVRSGAARKLVNFTCRTGLTGHGQSAATVVSDQDLNLSLPILEQNPDIGSALDDAPVVAERMGGKFRTIVEVQAPTAAPCPAVRPSPDTAPASVGSMAPPAGATSSSFTTTLPSHAATPSPSPSATTSAAASPNAMACYTPISAGATPITYRFPTPTAATTVTTSETLNNVILSNERIDSMYPPGNITTKQVIWHGGVGLSPTLNATNLASAERQNKDAFWAGLLYGIAAALAIPYLIEFYRVWHDERDHRVKDQHSQAAS